jgi:hypothetical protein
MRNLILSAAAALLVCALPGVAAAQSGYIDLSYGNNSVDLGGGDADYDVGAIGGAVSLDAGSLGVQLGARYANASADGGGDVDGLSGDAHLFTRGQQWQFGAGIGLTSYDGGAGADYEDATIAGEALYFMDRATIAGAVSYSTADDLDVDTTAIDGEVRFFPSDNTRLSANVGFGNFDAGGGADDNFVSLGVGGEYQFDAYPVSLFAGYQRTSFDEADVESDSLNVGVRWNFGGSLFDRDRSGANLSAPRGVASRLLGL